MKALTRYFIFDSITKRFFKEWDSNIPRFTEDFKSAKFYNNLGTGGPQKRKLQMYFNQMHLPIQLSLKSENAYIRQLKLIGR